MIDTNSFGALLKAEGFTFFTGVPCSFLKSLINYALNECEFVMAANEGDAVAIASGASLAGQKSVVLMQNSGLTNATSPLTSLNYIFKIPVLGFVSLRGLAHLKDEPQHELMGEITTDFLDSMRIPWEYLSANLEEATAQLYRANTLLKSGKSFFFVVKKDTFDSVTLKSQKGSQEKSLELPKRSAALSAITDLAGNDTFIVATTGFTGRELFQDGDRPENIYMVGSMGCAPSLALGLALAQPEKRFIIIDGDGALLMRMGALATLAHYRPKNLLHILLDNEAHDSTGGQFTVSGGVDWIGVARACGYPHSIFAKNTNELGDCITHWKNQQDLTFLTMKIAPGASATLGRPSLKPAEVADRFQKRLLQPHD